LSYNCSRPPTPHVLEPLNALNYAEPTEDSAHQRLQRF
jgi:hypothetical protein